MVAAALSCAVAFCDSGQRTAGFLTSHYLIFNLCSYFRFVVTVAKIRKGKTNKQTPVPLATGEPWGHPAAWELEVPGETSWESCSAS